MGFSQIALGNFKSFRDLRVELHPFNVLIGANASGKSNFLQAFRFIRDIAIDGLDNAVSLQGGVEYLRNVRLGASEPLVVEIRYAPNEGRGWALSLAGDHQLQVREATYRFALRFKQRGSGFSIAQDEFTLAGRVFALGGQKPLEVGEGTVTASKTDGQFTFGGELPPGVAIDAAWADHLGIWDKREMKKTLLMENRFFYFFPMYWRLSRDIGLYDFDPRLPKRAVPITGKAELDEGGGNLAIVLKSIIEQSERRHRLSALMKDLLPFVENLDVESFSDKSLLFTLKETYWKGFLPASLISDGTVNVAALLVALYFERRWLTIIEEPERNVHPHLLSRLVGAMKEASRKKQIIITTQNPEVVRATQPESLLLVRRDASGFSVVSRPREAPELQTFLANDIGLDDLYVQNLLESFQ